MSVFHADVYYIFFISQIFRALRLIPKWNFVLPLRKYQATPCTVF